MARCRPRWPTIGSWSGLTCSPTRNRAGVLEVVAGDDAAQGLAGRERLAVAGVDVADLALGNGHQRHLVDAVLPAPQAEVHAAAEHLGLEAGLAVEGDDPAFGDRSLRRPQLLDDADAVVGDVPQAGQLAESHHAHDQGDQPEQAVWQIPQGRDDRRDLPGTGPGHDRCHILEQWRSHRLNSFGERTRENSSNRNNP